ncbi:hypothetical protein Droror1_Dr00002285 [Drosera rotundifolia]
MENDCSFALSLQPGNHSSVDLLFSLPLRYLGLSSRLIRSPLLFSATHSSATHSSPLGSLATRHSHSSGFMFCAYVELQMKDVLMVFIGVRLSDAASLELNDFIECGVMWTETLVSDLENVVCCRYPGTGEYDKFFEEGIYTCAGCGTPLYRSTPKFNLGCGWPAFFEGLPGAINRTPNPDGRRVEITCAACGGHLGHIFKGEGFPTPTEERHCVNSVSLKFVPENANPSS